jgi:hypothetical protein
MVLFHPGHRHLCRDWQVSSSLILLRHRTLLGTRFSPATRAAISVLKMATPSSILRGSFQAFRISRAQLNAFQIFCRWEPDHKVGQEWRQDQPDHISFRGPGDRAGLLIARLRRIIKSLLLNGDVRIYPSLTYKFSDSESSGTSHTAHLIHGYRCASLTVVEEFNKGPTEQGDNSTVYYFHSNHLQHDHCIQ